VKYLLDTNICIYAIKRRPENIAQKLAKISARNEVCVSAISMAEMQYGASKSQSQARNREALLKFLLPFEVLAFSDAAATYYGVIRADLESAGQPIGGHDMLIAAQAMSGGYVLVTNNTREFARIDGLNVENWV
jgi:tRNA(fMet)-specific endonuclease VapC